MAPETRSLLLAEAELAVRRHGYAGFSYADLTDRVGIRKASIHHHFPVKADLGNALVEEYTERFAAALATIAAASPDALARLAAYAGLYRAGLLAGQGCLCGVLASELAGLPERMRAGVRNFFALQAAWLGSVLGEGQAAGSIRADVPAAAQAGGVLAALQGAMLVGQALGDPADFDVAIDAVLAGLGAPPPNHQRGRHDV